MVYNYFENKISNRIAAAAILFFLMNQKFLQNNLTNLFLGILGHFFGVYLYKLFRSDAPFLSYCPF